MCASANTIRLVLADDHAVTRDGLRTILKAAPDIQIVGEAQDGLEAQQLTAQLHPHILLLDLIMPGPRPAEIERWVRANCPETVTLILTAHDRNVYLAEMMEAGAVGLLRKNEVTASHLIDAIRRAARGEILFDAEQLARVQRWREEVASRWYSLTARERQVLTLIAAGKTDREIADDLQISVKTVSNHVYRILDKLEAASRTEAVLWAVKEGFITQDDAT